MNMKLFFAGFLVSFVGQVGAMDVSSLPAKGDDAASVASTVPVEDISAFDRAMNDVRGVLNAVDSMLREKKRSMRPMNAVENAFTATKTTHNYGAVIALIEVLKHLEQKVLVPQDDLQNEVSTVIENLENLDAPQDGEIISEYQELVAECSKVLEGMTALLPKKRTKVAQAVIDNAENRVEIFLETLTPYSLNACANSLIALAALTGRQKGKQAKVAEALRGKLMSLRAD